MNFMDKKHEARFEELCALDKTSINDMERRTLFYILSSNEDIFQYRNNIYDLGEHLIKPEEVNELPLSSAEMALVKLGLNLYNDYGEQTITRTFSNLGAYYFKVAMNAIQLRFPRQTGIS